MPLGHIEGYKAEAPQVGQLLCRSCDNQNPKVRIALSKRKVLPF